ncbi:MAG: hypothetical protein CVV49_00555 [Spirochaetae bacterium HGW-Spirochaetae-5]|nr:MAG: hypothetical protein CVV49_00555 [Spirochaetae bacterium HGW-Spirochaetae-5]
MENENQLTGEQDQATPAFDNQTDSSFDKGMETDIDSGEVQSDISDAPQGKYVPLEVVESMKEQTRELKEQNQQLLQLILSNRQQQERPEQQTQEEQFQIADDEFLTGAQLKAILAQQQQSLNRQNEAYQAEQRQAFINEQKQAYINQHPDYNDVLNTVNAEALKDPAIADIIMRSKNPVETAYRYGKLLRGESFAEVNSVKKKVNMENKINQNLNQAKTLSNIKTKSPGNGDDDFDALYRKIKGY